MGTRPHSDSQADQLTCRPFFRPSGGGASMPETARKPALLQTVRARPGHGRAVHYADGKYRER